MSKTQITWLIAFLLFAGSIILSNNWKKWFGSANVPSNGGPADGTACTTADGKPGIMAKGVCTATGGAGPTPSPTQRNNSTVGMTKSEALSRIGAAYDEPVGAYKK